MGEVMIQLQDVTMAYDGKIVIKSLDLAIAKGSKTVIIGPSGSGKSTLLRSMNLFERPLTGQVFVDGTDLMMLSSHGLCRIREKIGMVFQSFNLYPHLTVLDNLTLAPRLLKKTSREQAEEEGMQRLSDVGLADKRTAYPAELSGGQMQRVAIARALCMKPKILLFDEPTSALDPEMISEVLDIMQEVGQSGDITMIVVTHEMGFASHFADRVIFLDDGFITEDGNPDEVFLHPKNERTKQFFSKILKSA
ncbi:MAG: amino acid ABC transporter ATP-binding protein [Sphaerochaetaceae bacterium]